MMATLCPTCTREDCPDHDTCRDRAELYYASIVAVERAWAIREFRRENPALAAERQDAHVWGFTVDDVDGANRDEHRRDACQTRARVKRTFPTQPRRIEMGYCMSQDDAKFTVTMDKHAGALKKLKALVKSTKLTWVTTENILTAKTLADAMEELRWPVEEDEDGNIISINFEGEKAGDEMKFFGALAEYVDAGCFIEMHGEDGSRWRWVFANGKVTEKAASVSWE